MRERFEDWRFGLLCLVLIIVGGVAVQFPQPTASGVDSDIYYAYREGQRIAAGEDPYARVLAGDMQQNDKYATYLPLFYLLSALSQRLGLQDYASWIAFWRGIFMLFNIGIACLLYWSLFRLRLVWLAILTAAFWFLNRWTNYVTRAATLEFVPIFFLLLSLLLLRKQRYAAYVLFGVSLALKQVAIWLVPLYLIWAWRVCGEDCSHRRREILLAAVGITTVPLLASLPFLINDPKAFIYSIAFSVTRNPGRDVGAPSIDEALQLTGVAARLPMFSLMALCYAAVWRGQLGLIRSAFLLMTLFIDLSPVLYRQYFSWIVVLLPLAVVEGKWPVWENGSEIAVEAPGTNVAGRLGKDHHAGGL